MQIYKFSKLSRLLRTINFMMDDTLRTVVTDNLHTFCRNILCATSDRCVRVCVRSNSCVFVCDCEWSLFVYLRTVAGSVCRH